MSSNLIRVATPSPSPPSRVLPPKTGGGNNPSNEGLPKRAERREPDRNPHLPPPNMGEVTGRRSRPGGGGNSTNPTQTRHHRRAATPLPLAFGSGTPPENGGRKQTRQRGTNREGRKAGAGQEPTLPSPKHGEVPGRRSRPGGGGNSTHPTLTRDPAPSASNPPPPRLRLRYSPRKRGEETTPATDDYPREPKDVSQTGTHTCLPHTWGR